MILFIPSYYYIITIYSLCQKTILNFKLKKKSKYKKYDSYNGAKESNYVNKFNKLNVLQTTSIRKAPVDKTKINIAKSNIKSLLKSPIIFDGRNLLNKKELEEIGFVYQTIGS